MPTSLTNLLTALPPAVGLAALGALLALLLLAWSVRRHGQCLRALAAQQTLLVELRARLDLVASQQHQALADAGRLREQLGARAAATQGAVTAGLAEQRAALAEAFGGLREQIGATLAAHRTSFERRQADGAQRLGEQLQQGSLLVQRQLAEALARSAAELGQRVDALTRTTEARLQDIAGQVDRRLADGFEKTTATFADVLQRLALIDEAQKRITALSSEVVSLQQVLADKRSRGAFGEVQLAALVRNVMPEAHFALQHALPNGRIADCALFLPPPTGTLAIDAKFPLEAWRRLADTSLSELERRQAERQFKLDIRKHIRDIASKYIVPNVTADGAIMFIPAEAVFAEIQGHHPELVDEAHAARVWLVSPTTLWAVLTTACAVLKDAATREQVDIIQHHLGHLGKDFERFRERMDALARHIAQAHDDVQKVHVSARRIAERFGRIEKVELGAGAELTTEPGVSGRLETGE
ncbi:MAG TPA: DNA recombination protein RmuC [Gammaproteobacteria bacterium]|nr:DNA recombination protein RmuC [Gammaproteobacteria bacterium]